MTEIWCSSVCDANDLRAILVRSLQQLHNDCEIVADKILDFVVWFTKNYSHMRRYVVVACLLICFSCDVTVRELLQWTKFMCKCGNDMPVQLAFLHGAAMTLIDALGIHV